MLLFLDIFLFYIHNLPLTFLLTLNKHLKMSSIYTCVPIITIIWCMLLRYGVWHNFCHFGPFFDLLPHYWPPKLKFGKNVRNTWRYYPFPYVYHKRKSYHMKYGSWDIRHNRVFCHFLPFDPTNNLKNLNFEKMKKTPGDIIILHKHTINYNHDVWFPRYEAWPTELFAVLGHFSPFYPTNNPKNQNFEKMKKSLAISTFYTCVPKIMIK